MSKTSQLRLLGTMLLVSSSFVFSGCSAQETKLEPDLSKSSSPASPELLTAGLKTLHAGESENAATSLLFYVSNNTAVDKKLLIWNTPLEQPLSAEIFSVQFNGANLDYQGRKIKRGSPMPEHLLSVEAGETVESVVDIANYYDMSEPGSYTVSLDPAQIAGVHHLNDQTPINLVADTLTITVCNPDSGDSEQSGNDISDCL